MSAQPSEQDSHDVIRLGGETALVVPVHEFHTLKALRNRASAEQVQQAEIDAVIAEHEAWKAAGRPGPEVATTGAAAITATAKPAS